MTLLHLLVFSGLALITSWLIPRRMRVGFLLAGSILAIYWLQSSTPIRNLDFWLPSASIGLTVWVWSVTHNSPGDGRSILAHSSIILATVLLVGLNRYIEPLCCLTPSRPPAILSIILFLGLGATLAVALYRLPHDKLIIPALFMVGIMVVFIVLKHESLGRLASAWLRSQAGQSAELASALDLPWLGLSYLAFRLIHALRDHQAGKLPVYTLGEFATYALFFPAYPAGPIDRSQHFVEELHRSTGSRSSVAKLEDLAAGGQRILIGSFKKFVLADSLALFALNAQNATQASSIIWNWVLLYAFAFRIYCDFAGYTDIAIGLGRLAGIQLPENFDRPYLKQNLTAFWNSWHITLAQWFRAYFFNPITRALRSRQQKVPAWAIILIGQLSTMLLIGLWHGITWNYAAWGAWHGIGLFMHNRWSNWMRPRLAGLEERPRARQLLQTGSWLLTFQFVTLGWVWFALPTPALAWEVLLKLVGVR